MTGPPVGGPPPPPGALPPPVDPAVIEWAQGVPPVPGVNLSGERATQPLRVVTNAIERTPTGMRATGLAAVIESAGPYLVSLAALAVAAFLHDIHAVELIGGGVVGGGIGYGVARGRRG